MEEDNKYYCPKCNMKFSLYKTWEKGKWIYFCLTKGCNYRKEEKITHDEADEFNGGS